MSEREAMDFLSVVGERAIRDCSTARMTYDAVRRGYPDCKQALTLYVQALRTENRRLMDIATRRLATEPVFISADIDPRVPKLEAQITELREQLSLERQARREAEERARSRL